MQKKYKNINVNYEFYDNDSNENLIFLHGWGQNIAMMQPIAKPFIKKHNVLILDLPGFGESDEPTEIWSIYDYTEMVGYFVKELKLINPIIIGHSFGGKIALTYAIKYEPKKVVLLASPYKKKKKKESLKLKVLKSLKKVPGLNKLENVVKKHMGSTDYRNANIINRTSNTRNTFSKLFITPLTYLFPSLYQFCCNMCIYFFALNTIYAKYGINDNIKYHFIIYQLL